MNDDALREVIRYCETAQAERALLAEAIHDGDRDPLLSEDFQRGAAFAFAAAAHHAQTQLSRETA